MSREKIALRVVKGALVPSDSYAMETIRKRGFKMGDILLADLTKPRNYKFDKLVHRIGQLVVKNIEEFENMTAHEALKQLQIDGNIACKSTVVDYPGIGKSKLTVPQSLSHEITDDGQMHEIARAMCRYIAQTYWPEMTEEQVNEMAETFVDE